MFSSKIEKMCDSHNNSLCQIRHVRTYPAEKFLGSLSGNLLITGGSPSRRRQLLKDAIVQQRRNSSEPVIIFSESPRLQEDLIRMAEQNLIGELCVCSDEYRNYDFFYNMKPNQIIDYFKSIATLSGYRDTGEITDFLGAFVNILSERAPLKLASMLEFSKNSDTAIAGSSGKSGSDYDILTASARGGINFRRLLGSVADEFDSISKRNCDSDFNISSSINDDCVILINTSAVNFDFMSLYFLQELKGVLNKRFTMVFDDSILLNNREFLDFVNMAKQRNNITVITSHENILSLPGEKNTDHFKRQIILLDGNIAPQKLQELLTSFGEYSHFEATESLGTPPRLFMSIRRTFSKGITPYSRPKLLLEEIYGNSAVLFGHSGAEILIVKKF